MRPFGLFLDVLRRSKSSIATLILLAAFAVLCFRGATSAPMNPLPERVTFQSADGSTALVGYLFKPEGPHAAQFPAVVMMHGRAGAYSSAAKTNYNAATLSQRHQKWGHLWAQQGYAALLVDGFGPRGYPAGFPRFSYDQRPDALNEITVRPLDAYGALAWLRTRSDILPDSIALQGWSNGGSATLAAMALTSLPGAGPGTRARGFLGAVAFYPACGLKDRFTEGLVPYAPVQILQGLADEEVSPRRCKELVEKSRARNADIRITLYPGATHDFDDPGTRRQSVAANVAANDDAVRRATEFFASLFKSQAANR
jgi:dienelactone hydrolase